jgi:hypothetical protein
MSRFLKRLGVLGALVLATSGCAMMADVAATSAVVAVVDRTVSDYTEKECRVADMIRKGAMCKVPAPPQPPPAPVYCFKTLGGTDCYSDPDPYDLARAPRTQSPQPLVDPPLAPAWRDPLASAPRAGEGSGADTVAPKATESQPATYTKTLPNI